MAIWVRGFFMSQGCGLLTRGDDPKDDLIACGTKLWLGKDAKSRTESVLLCAKCKVDETTKL
jgi:hypothetical protein